MAQEQRPDLLTDRRSNFRPEQPQVSADEWVSFPGGELEGKRPRTRCPACREAIRRGRVGRPKPLCFACYRAELDRRAIVQRALAAAGRLDAGSDARFQFQLPFEPVDHRRLDALKADRQSARQAERRTRVGAYVDRRRHAQIAARHALRQIAVGFHARQPAVGEKCVERLEGSVGRLEERRLEERRLEKRRLEKNSAMAAVFDASDLQLPESWIPFVMSRSRVR